MIVGSVQFGLLYNCSERIITYIVSSFKSQVSEVNCPRWLLIAPLCGNIRKTIMNLTCRSICLSSETAHCNMTHGRHALSRPLQCKVINSYLELLTELGSKRCINIRHFGVSWDNLNCRKCI
jgi:hypothetical protein